MTPAARLSAAIEVLADIEARRRPAADALKDWGLSHRFAGSKDRAALASLVYDGLRRRASAAWIMGAQTPRAVMLGTLRALRSLDVAAIAALASGERFAPEPLSDDERERLASGTLEGAPAHVAGDFPDWVEPSLARLLGDDLVPEMTAMAARAPLDVRVNTLKAAREEAHQALVHLDMIETPLSPLGLRVPPGPDGRGPALQAEPEFIKGWVEIQDEGSQIAAMLAGVTPQEQVVDLCAGGGGKTLALAALMDNGGQIYATDNDLRRLAPIHDRLQRAGIRNVQVRTPRGRADDPVDDLDGRMGCVFVDAPCTGSGTWRRNPDTKWRVRPNSLESRLREQAAVLDRAARLARPGGRVVYVTCSLFPEENDDALDAFLGRSPGFAPVAPAELAARGPEGFAARVRPTRHGLQMTPLKTGTDGFFVSVLRRG
jgi:16S rRNA (cytosine967-C5)-methyltransferase